MQRKAARPEFAPGLRIAPRTIALAGLVFTATGTFVYTQLAAGTSQLLLGVAQVCSGIGTGAALVPIMSAGFRGLEPAAVPRASSSIRIMQQLGGSFGSAALFIIVQHELTTHTRNASGLAAAFGATFWWVLAFAGAMLIPVLFLPGRGRGAGVRESGRPTAEAKCEDRSGQWENEPGNDAERRDSR